MKNFLKIKDNFPEGFILRMGALLGVALGMAILLVVYRRYNIFLDLLPVLSVGVAVVAIILIIVNRSRIWLPEVKKDYAILFFLLIFVVFNGFHFSEYVSAQGGNDVGSYFEAATLLSKTGDYYEDYAKKPIIISTPGYYPSNSSLTRMLFIPGNPTYFSIFHHLFGINGFPVGLSLALFLSCSFIYFLCKRLRGWKTGVVFLAFFLFNYYVIYFSRAPWVENLQLLFVWTYVYMVVRGVQEKSLFFLLAASLPIGLLMHFRLEAVLYLLIYFLILIYIGFRRAKFRDWPRESLIPAAFLFMFAMALIVSVFIFDPSALLTGDESSLQTIIKTVAQPAANIAWQTGALIPYNQQIFIWFFLFYAFSPIMILLGVLSFLNFFSEDNKTRRLILLITLLILPQFVFLLRPSVQLYLNWAMRRFYGVFIPYVFILFALLITNHNNFISRTSQRLMMVFVIIFWFVASFPGLSIINLVEGKGIIAYEKQVASNFGPDDLVIFWDRYGYENLGPPLHFLFDTNVVYDRSPAFDREVYALFMKDYKNIYIASSYPPTGRLYGYFEEVATFVKTLSSPVFPVIADSSCHLGSFAINPQSFSGYGQITEICQSNNPQTKIVPYQVNLNIYKLDKYFRDLFIEKYYDPDYHITRATKHLFSGEE